MTITSQPSFSSTVIYSTGLVWKIVPHNASSLPQNEPVYFDGRYFVIDVSLNRYDINLDTGKIVYKDGHTIFTPTYTNLETVHDSDGKAYTSLLDWHKDRNSISSFKIYTGQVTWLHKLSINEYIQPFGDDTTSGGALPMKHKKSVKFKKSYPKHNTRKYR